MRVLFVFEHVNFFRNLDGVARELQLRGEYSALFYDLKQRIAGASAAAELQAVDDEVGACRDALAEYEQRKLRLTLSRRWKAL